MDFEETENKLYLFSVPKLFTISKFGKILRELNQSQLIDQKSALPNHNEFLKPVYERGLQNVLVNLYQYVATVKHNKFVLRLVMSQDQLNLKMHYLMFHLFFCMKQLKVHD